MAATLKTAIRVAGIVGEQQYDIRFLSSLGNYANRIKYDENDYLDPLHAATPNNQAAKRSSRFGRGWPTSNREPC